MTIAAATSETPDDKAITMATNVSTFIEKLVTGRVAMLLLNSLRPGDP